VPGVISCQNKAADHAAAVRSRAERWFYGNQHRLGGARWSRAASGKEARPVHARQHPGPRSAWTAQASPSPTACASAWPRSIIAAPTAPCSPNTALELTQEPEFEMGGGGLYSTAGGLSQVRAHDAEPGQVRPRRGRCLKPRDGGRDVQERHGRHQGMHAQDPRRRPFSNDAEFFPGMDKQWGLTFMINNEEAPTGRSPGSLAWGGTRQHLLLDRPERRAWGGVLHHSDPALRRREVPAAVLCFRGGGAVIPAVKGA